MCNDAMAKVQGPRPEAQSPSFTAEVPSWTLDFGPWSFTPPLYEFELAPPRLPPENTPSMFTEVKSVHFIGIGGTAMASVAGAMKDKGFVVSGSDQNVYPPMSTFLAAKQIAVMNGYSESNLNHKPDLVVVGNAISRGNP